MKKGKILAARCNGAYVLRFEGDVRLTLSTSLDDYLQQMFSDPDFVSVWVDLCLAEGIDSTTLGLLAKLALKVKEKFGFHPAIYCLDPSIIRLLKSMGFVQLFELHDHRCNSETEVCEIPAVDGDERAVREKVLEAHRTLMELNSENRARFTELVTALEQR